ncbi:hypothetical protein CWE13_03060 [Aliidiomarina shirensis]|uniref:Uncharacterized protein n=1 Tax=Aliidiomarina shirensis TaxID=1048642 RepID=A0A432WXW0_9GAMM|nr:hypothetical protein [Aliidiomarina shirensis]RUO38640.1 hypothetical protein CWE13_03060 [Aliidiomarina shirensis]
MNSAILKRLLVLIGMLALSVVLFPLLAFAIPVFSNFLFFWPQCLLLPYGFVNIDIGASQAFFVDSAIFGAILFWFVFAAVFGYVLRDKRIRYVAILSYPLAFAVMFIFYGILLIFGYSVYLEGL